MKIVDERLVDTCFGDVAVGDFFYHEDKLFFAVDTDEGTIGTCFSNFNCKNCGTLHSFDDDDEVKKVEVEIKVVRNI